MCASFHYKCQAWYLVVYRITRNGCSFNAHQKVDGDINLPCFRYGSNLWKSSNVFVLPWRYNQKRRRYIHQLLQKKLQMWPSPKEVKLLYISICTCLSMYLQWFLAHILFILSLWSVLYQLFGLRSEVFINNVQWTSFVIEVAFLPVWVIFMYIVGM